MRRIAIYFGLFLVLLQGCKLEDPDELNFFNVRTLGVEQVRDTIQGVLELEGIIDKGPEEVDLEITDYGFYWS
ncbi:MAG: hypothetical protein AAF242_17915, partial [Bacteroidota bacterium]